MTASKREVGRRARRDVMIEGKGSRRGTCARWECSEFIKRAKPSALYSSSVPIPYRRSLTQAATSEGAHSSFMVEIFVRIVRLLEVCLAIRATRREGSAPIRQLFTRRSEDRTLESLRNCWWRSSRNFPRFTAWTVKEGLECALGVVLQPSRFGYSRLNEIQMLTRFSSKVLHFDIEMQLKLLNPSAYKNGILILPIKGICKKDLAYDSRGGEGHGQAPTDSARRAGSSSSA
ncbi:hypothetical protein BKA70DRAFT_1226469 [Coprinopsis sp. MPI-PUGE-AT-0042]|nr:hypothetical protein BKA70DRAFT_1226469 [Coprinopsis sp. MPI-PUGE-AT-0042]